jgi:NADPH-dependent glutamate synthase beta subunit-like oxidoreductase
LSDYYLSTNVSENNDSESNEGDNTSRQKFAAFQKKKNNKQNSFATSEADGDLKDKPLNEERKSMFDGKRVLVIGSGETSFDIAFDAAKNNASKIAMVVYQTLIIIKKKKNFLCLFFFIVASQEKKK